MYIDSLTLAAVADEWRFLLMGARIDTIIQPSEYSLALQCYAPSKQPGEGGRNRWIYLSAHPQFARAHITALKPPKITSDPPSFVMLLRKYLEGTRIESISQPRWERVLEIVASYKHDEEIVRFRLIVEIMGRISNLIFCNEEGMILGSLKRVGSDVNRYRTIATNLPYVPPPPQTYTFAGQQLPRLEPTTVTAASLSILTNEQEASAESQPQKRSKKSKDQEKLWNLLSRHLLGLSPLVAREAVYRATGDIETPLRESTEDLWEELAWNIRDLTKVYDAHTWQPRLLSQRDPVTQELRPLAFAAYRLEQYAEREDLEIHESSSINVLLDDYFARIEYRDALDDIRAPIRRVLQNQQDRCLRKAALLEEQMQSTAEANHYRLQAELLLANQQEVTQGQPTVTLDNFYLNDGSQETIPLDPRFDAVGNANRLFNKYHKLRRALGLVPDQIEQNRAELATIEQLLNDLSLAESPAEIALVKAEVQAAGYLRGQRLEEKKKQVKGKGSKQGKGRSTGPGGGVPMHFQSADGFTLLVGKNSRQNEEVTFRQATSHDLWLHARGVPGSHVIVKAAGREVPQSTIEQAASLAAYYSQARGIPTAPVDYTLQRHVRHMKNGGPGMVIYERERTLFVKPSTLA